MARILIGDVEFAKSPFQDGDRVIVRTFSIIDHHQVASIKRSVEKFAGCPIEVMVVNNTSFRMVCRRGAHTAVICGPELGGSLVSDVPGTFNLDCKAVDFQPGDVLEVHRLFKHDIPEQAKDYIRKWAGSDVEVIFV